MFFAPTKQTFTLLRIPFSFLLMPLFLLAISQTAHIDVAKTIASFLIIHLLVYPASNGYNSYIDRDEGAIGGLEKPPLPTLALFQLTVFMDAVAVVASYLLISSLFGASILLYISASRAYSSKQIRLKKHPVLGLLTVIIFQGGFTYFMSLIGISSRIPDFDSSLFFILMACTFQIAGAYPLTQIYQHEADEKDGIITISYRLGKRGTFLFTAGMFILCNLFYFLYFESIQQAEFFFILQLFFIPILLYFAHWFRKVIKNNEQANFKNTMRMNLLAATCMNGCFLFFTIINHF